LAVSLAHEAAHSLLFGLAVGGQLTENDAAERYSSPLRRDPRPMEGVAHATYVTARMAYALEAMIGAGVLDQDEMARAGDQLAHDKAVCIQGLATVMADAGLTPAGEAAFAGLRQYVRHWD
jgi:HEXXH motif-containing protein